MAFSDYKTLDQVQKVWEFGKLVEATLIKNVEGYTVDHLPRLCAVLNAVFQATLDVNHITNEVIA